jgi:flavin-dependent dehydrogenase
MDVDAVIVGASLAGCATAVLLAQRGCRVALVDRIEHEDAFKRLCSHHIHASATPVLHRLGLAPALQAAGAIPNGMQAWTPWGWIRPTPDTRHGRASHGYNIRRQVLDPLLRRHAAATPGVTLLLGRALEGLVWAGDRVAGVRLRHACGTEELRSRLVVGADGSHSHVARAAACAERVRANERVAYFAYYEGVQFKSPHDSLIWFGNPGYGFAFPNEHGIAQLGCYPSRPGAAAWGTDPHAHFEQALRALPDFPAFDSRRRVGRLMRDQSLRSVTRQCTKPGLALVGDAALVSDPIWGSGCTWALQSAAWLADSVAEHLDSASALDAAVRAYARLHAHQTRWHQWLMIDYSRARRFNPVERLIFSAAARDARIATHLHAYGSRHIAVSEFLHPRALAHAAWVNLRHAVRPAGATGGLAAHPLGSERP